MLCYLEVKSIKTDRFQTQTVNINLRSFFRYPTITWPVADVVLPNRYLSQKRNPTSLCKKWGSFYHHMLSLV
jgi:hypothetical protein